MRSYRCEIKGIIVLSVLLLASVAAGQVRFIDRTAELFSQEAIGSKAAWADVDNDGWVDLLAGDTLWKNEHGSGFTRLASVNSGVIADYDNDGFADIFCYSNGRLLRNVEGAEFQPQDLPELPTTISQSASWGDFDNDGDLDLYLGGYEVWPDQEFPDVILQNDDGDFVIDWRQSTILRARGITSCDFDNDGDIDIYVSNYRLQPNMLLLNDGTGSFTDVAELQGVQGDGDLGAFGHTIGSAWGDLDNDGNIDLFVGNFSHPPDYQDRPKFYRNMGQNEDYCFEDVSRRAGLAWQESYACPALADYDNDGDLDLYFTTVYPGDYPVLYRNDGDWHFTDVTDEAGLAQLPSTYQAAWADFDNDGDLDLVTAGRLYVNQGNDSYWLKVRLSGGDQNINRSAIGAQVRINLQGQTLTRQVEAGTGEGNQNDLTLHFGLGERRDDVDLQILWPGGATGTVDDVAVDQTITVVP